MCAALLQLCGIIFLSAITVFAAEREQKTSDAQQLLVRDVSLNELGISESVVFDVPQNARSLTVTVVGDPERIYALASLRTPDGMEHVGWDEKQSPGTTLNKIYREEHICHFPGTLRQCPRLGTLTLVYPNKPGQKLPAGPTALRISSEKAGNARVHVFLSEQNKANVLHLNFFTVSRRTTSFDTRLLAKKIQDIFDQAEIQIVIDNEVALNETGFSDLTNPGEFKATALRRAHRS